MNTSIEVKLSNAKNIESFCRNHISFQSESGCGGVISFQFKDGSEVITVEGVIQ